MLQSASSRYLVENIDWLEDQITNYNDDYLIIDCPGQIELYTHFPVVKAIVSLLQRHDYNVCGVYLIDALFVDDTSKYFAGVLSALAAMVQFEIPHINVMSKMDLVKGTRHKRDLEKCEPFVLISAALLTQICRFFEPDARLLLAEDERMSSGRFLRLNEAIAALVGCYCAVCR